MNMHAIWMNCWQFVAKSFVWHTYPCTISFCVSVAIHCGGCHGTGGICNISLHEGYTKCGVLRICVYTSIQSPWVLCICICTHTV